MKHEQERPRGILPYGTEIKAIDAAHYIVNNHRLTQDERDRKFVKSYSQLHSGEQQIKSFIGGLVAIAMMGYLLTRKESVGGVYDASATTTPNTPTMRSGDMQSIRDASELFCASEATATSKPTAYTDCVEKQVTIRERRNDLYTSPNYFATTTPKPQPLPIPNTKPVSR